MFEYNLDKVNKIYFIGIGGSSMSGLAKFMIKAGKVVSGSDRQLSQSTEYLINQGATIVAPHNAKFLAQQQPDMVVYTVAISEDNEELVAAKQMGIPTIVRADFLGMLMQTYKTRIAISGTHGKTTTTSMISTIVYQNGLDPSIHLGGILPLISSNTHVGTGDIFITEACEYHRSFLSMPSNIAVVLNVELDHVDYFKDLDDFKQAFIDFIKLVPNDGTVILNGDDANALSIAPHSQSRVVTFGLTRDCEWRAEDIQVNSDGKTTYTLLHLGEPQCSVALGVAGTHNVLNSMAAIAACVAAGLSVEHCAAPLAEFTGAGRRFEKVGEKNGICIIDDYAHHPTEIVTTLAAAKNMNNSSHTPGKIWCVFQPHTYTRTRELFDMFSHSFEDADHVLVTDIYAAREKNPGNIHSRDLATAINNQSHNAEYVDSFKSAVDIILENAKPNDIVFTMGAGDINSVGKMILNTSLGE